MDWWANLLQGGISAVIGGIVAALTAWAVVAGTGRQAHRQALIIDARNAARTLIRDTEALMRAVMRLSRSPERRDRREWLLQLDEARVAFFNSCAVNIATIAAVDEGFEQRLFRLMNEIHEEMTGFKPPWMHSRSWRGAQRRMAGRPDPERRTPRFETLTGTLVEELTMWLAGRRPVPSNPPPRTRRQDQ
ncbi:hypothetical protein ACBJ59_24490 [Nonomuraea sp. MTCD27]|uniref:hypothetical protein n=1 Tax=Nonomuraea sp. MTCD27 TaxID=1676747 RepID=UPI0035BF6B19